MVRVFFTMVEPEFRQYRANYSSKNTKISGTRMDSFGNLDFIFTKISRILVFCSINYNNFNTFEGNADRLLRKELPFQALNKVRMVDVFPAKFIYK